MVVIAVNTKVSCLPMVILSVAMEISLVSMMIDVSLIIIVFDQNVVMAKLSKFLMNF